MRIAHLADLHLGFRQYHRVDARGINVREADVANAFAAAVDGVIAARPDAVIIAGDLFHAVRPTNWAIVFAFQQFRRLREALPTAPVVILAGNHETPRTSETGSILRLYEELGIHLAADTPRRFSFADGDLAVLAVPESALKTIGRAELVPAGPERHQVLLLHGEVDGVIRGTRPSEGSVDPAALTGQPWSYVALGHYHVQHEVAPRVWYAGAIDYTSSNIWGELADEARLGLSGKGWLVADLEAGTVTRHAIPPARTVYDAPVIEGHDLPASEVDRQIVEALAEVPGGLADSIVRLIVRDIPREVSRELDHARIRSFKAHALHLQLNLELPVSARSVGVDATGRRLTLAELLAEKLRTWPLPARLSREQFVAAGEQLLEEVDEAPPADREVA